MGKQERLEKANQLLDCVKSCGRRFFETSGNKKYNAKFFINDKGNVYFIDDYTGAEICIRGDRIRKQGFSHGGGLNDFITLLGQYVKKGGFLIRHDFGHYWGYGDDIEIVRAKALELGITELPSTTTQGGE